MKGSSFVSDMPPPQQAFRPEPCERPWKLLVAVKVPVGILGVLVADVPREVEMMIGVFK